MTSSFQPVCIFRRLDEWEPVHMWKGVQHKPKSPVSWGRTLSAVILHWSSTWSMLSRCRTSAQNAHQSPVCDFRCLKRPRAQTYLVGNTATYSKTYIIGLDASHNFRPNHSDEIGLISAVFTHQTVPSVPTCSWRFHCTRWAICIAWPCAASTCFYFTTIVRLLNHGNPAQAA